MKTATSLFDFVPGQPVQPPTDAEMQEVHAQELDRKRLSILTEDIDTLCQRLKFLSHESRLTAARHISKGVNSTTRMFNCAIFLRDKDNESADDLFATTPKKAVQEEPDLL